MSSLSRIPGISLIIDEMRVTDVKIFDDYR